MTNYNERLDEILDGFFTIGTERHISELKQALASLTKEMVAEAKPKRAVIHYDELGIDRARKSAANSALDRFEQNLLKALEEK